MSSLFIKAVPERPLGVVSVTDLPMTGRVLDAELEPLQFLFGVNMQIELEDVGAVVAQHPLPVVDVLVAFRPDRFWHQIVHAHHEHIFVVERLKIAT